MLRRTNRSSAPGSYPNGNYDSPSGVEDSAGIRHHLLCVGIDISGDPGGRARSAAVPFGGHALSGGGSNSLRVDAAQGRRLTHVTRVEIGDIAGRADIRLRLWAVVLGGTPRSFGSGGGGDGDESGFHDALGDYFPGHAAAFNSTGGCSARGGWWG